jgi:hypothetical protein
MKFAPTLLPQAGFVGAAHQGPLFLIGTEGLEPDALQAKILFDLFFREVRRPCAGMCATAR